MAVPYPGNIPSNVSKDAKYSVRSGDGGYEIRLIFRLSAKEKALLTTDDHEELVEMVNDVKIECNGAPGGAFYINEFLDVLVPTTTGECYFAGTYQRLLEFDLDGETIGPRAREGLRPGEPWPGPHVGIRYKLNAGGNDISYERPSGPNRVITERLSDVHGAAAASRLARRIAVVKGESGGRIYLNECGEFFAPPSARHDEYTYLGALDDDLWFPPPEVPRP
jgi:hypothetical protein